MKRLARIYDKRLTADEAEQICRITVSFNLVAIFFLSVFALIAYKSYNSSYATILAWVGVISISNIGLFLLTGRMKLFVFITCFSYLLFCVYLQITGGSNNTGILWHYVYPVMVYYIAGLRHGALWSGSLIGIEIILMFMDDFSFFHAYYSLDFKLRFVATMIALSVFGAMLEHSRGTAQRNLILLAKKMEKASQTDELTGLINRRALKEALANEVVRTERTNRDFSVILCDIDHFKNVNDQYGHVVGDKALCHIATQLSQHVRKYDIVARWGGEEFMIILPDSECTAAVQIAERIRLEIENTPMKHQDGTILYLTISCGVCGWREQSQLEEIFQVADNRLYQAKTTGRNRVVGPKVA